MTLPFIRFRVMRIVAMSILACAAGCSAVGTPLGTSLLRITPAPRDHYDPAFLNEAAVAAWSKGERGTARILLERAAVIAPQDGRILHNLETARQAGSQAVLMHDVQSAPTSAQSPPVPVTATGKTVPVVPATAPPSPPEIGIWPPK